MHRLLRLPDVPGGPEGAQAETAATPAEAAHGARYGARREGTIPVCPECLRPWVTGFGCIELFCPYYGVDNPQQEMDADSNEAETT